MSADRWYKLLGAWEVDSQPIAVGGPKRILSQARSFYLEPGKVTLAVDVWGLVSEPVDVAVLRLEGVQTIPILVHEFSPVQALKRP